MKAKIFKNGESQAVRLPKEFRFSGKEVSIKKIGHSVVLSPIENSWDIMINSIRNFSDDFMQDRNQPREQQEREDDL